MDGSCRAGGGQKILRNACHGRGLHQYLPLCLSGSGWNSAVALQSGERFFIVELSDAGPPFDVLSIDSPDLEAGLMERKVGGLGIHFIRTLSDEVSYQRLAGHNILRMQFARSPGVASCNPNK